MSYLWISGIYKIQSKCKPERVYIGSAKSFQKRWYFHITSLRKNNHHAIKLQRHFNKYGEDDLNFSIIKMCPIEELLIAEQYFIDIYHPYFNSSPNAISGLGRCHSAESRKKMSLSHMGKSPGPMSTEGRKRLSESLRGNTNGYGNRGKERPEYIREKYRIATLAFYETEEGMIQKEKNRISNTGKKQSKETIEKRRPKLREAWRRRKIKEQINEDKS
jgi:group I intron endonuclease